MRARVGAVPMSLALTISYLFMVLVVVIVVVLLCLGCGCHVPLGKCVRCFCDNTTQCCRDCSNSRKKKEGEDKFKSVLDEPKRGADAKRKRAAQKKKAEDATSIAGCCSWIPYVLTCGMCCGALSDENEAKPGRGGSMSVNNNTNSNSTTNVVVAQPVVEDEDEDAVIGTEPIVAISMPLLAINN